jgi:hypothetical protein
MTDLLIGMASGYDWKTVEPYAISTVWSGFRGDKILFVSNLTDEACQNLMALGFGLIPIPQDLQFAGNKFAPYVLRFLLIYKYLMEHPDYRFVFCTDTRDVIFQRDPVRWMEKYLGDSKIVAASECCSHADSSPNMAWVTEAFDEVKEWMMPKAIYCSGVISGRADYVRDLAAGIYLAGRHLTATIWGADQPVMNTILHQRPWADVTLVPPMRDEYCINCHNISQTVIRKSLTDVPNIRPFYTPPGQFVQNAALLWNYGIPNLGDFTILHQYDRIPPLANAIRQRYTLARLGDPPFRIELTEF